MIDHLFSGSALCAVGPTGRLALPAFVRAVLARRGDVGGLLLGAHDVDPCAVGYDQAHARRLYADGERRRVAEEQADPDAHHARARRRFGLAEPAAPAANGQITLPAMIRHVAGIEDKVLVVGAGDTFELWAPARALASREDGLVALARWHLEAPRAA